MIKLKYEWKNEMNFSTVSTREGGGGTLGFVGWGCAAGTLDPLAYTRARFSEFCYSIVILD